MRTRRKVHFERVLKVSSVIILASWSVDVLCPPNSSDQLSCLLNVVHLSWRTYSMKRRK